MKQVTLIEGVVTHLSKNIMSRNIILNKDQTIEIILEISQHN